MANMSNYIYIDIYNIIVVTDIKSHRSAGDTKYSTNSSLERKGNENIYWAYEETAMIILLKNFNLAGGGGGGGGGNQQLVVGQHLEKWHRILLWQTSRKA